VLGWLKGGSKLELNIVDQAARCGPRVSLTNLIHKLDSTLPVVEDDRVENADIGEGAHSDDSFSNNSVVTFATHDQVIHIRAIGSSGPEASLAVSSL
jgi:hypothetical protein